MLAVLLAVVLLWLRPGTNTTSPDLPEEPVAPSASAGADLTVNAATGEVDEDAKDQGAAVVDLGDCDPLDVNGFIPTRYQMSNPQADEAVLSLGVDSDGAIAAPPKSEPRTASWWNQGPRPGSEAGKPVLSIHTYRNGGALGNEMYDGTPLMEAGDIIRLTDDEGRSACYEFVKADKIFMSDYDPDSDVMIDYDGDPLLTIVICWDFNSSTEDWDSRVFFYAQPIEA